MLPLCLMCLLWLGGRPSHAQDPPHPPGKKSTGERPKVICYYLNSAQYRNGKEKFTAEDIDPFLCTHLIYAFAVLDDTTLTMMPQDHYSDVQKRGYERVVTRKKKNGHLKVLLSLGDGSDSEGDKYSKMVADNHSRQKFVRKAVEMLKRYQFDGLDLKWEYLFCWKDGCSSRPLTDKDNFSRLLKELRKAFDQEKPPLLLTATVEAEKSIADWSYDADSLEKYLDFITVMAFSFRSYRDGKTGHPAPLDQQPEDNKYNNVIASMKYWNRERGVTKEKLILGVLTYGSSFTLANSSLHGLNAPTKGSGTACKYTGFLSYTEILERIEEQGWTVVRVPGVGPYAYGGNQWVGFDDPISAREKARLVRSQGYGGVMVWEMATDDFAATWSPIRSPLINSLKEELAGGDESRAGKETYSARSALALPVALLLSVFRTLL